jgi:hypothetical protein
VRDDQRAAIRLIALGYVDVAGDDDNEARADFAGGKKPFVRREAAAFAEPAHALDLQWIEIGKNLLAAPFDERLGC